MTGYHTRWVRPPEHADDPERIAMLLGHLLGGQRD